MENRIRVGTVLHMSRSSGNLILESENDIKIGDIITDARGKRVGTVFDVFGPVKRPYFSVRTKVSTPERLQGEALFVRTRKK